MSTLNTNCVSRVRSSIYRYHCNYLSLNNASPLFNFTAALAPTLSASNQFTSSRLISLYNYCSFRYTSSVYPIFGTSSWPSPFIASFCRSVTFTLTSFLGVISYIHSCIHSYTHTLCICVTHSRPIVKHRSNISDSSVFSPLFNSRLKT